MQKNNKLIKFTKKNTAQKYEYFLQKINISTFLFWVFLKVIFERK